MDGHATILRVFLAQEQNGSTMSRAAKQNLGSSGDQQIGETSPIFIVSIDDQTKLSDSLRCSAAV